MLIFQNYGPLSVEVGLAPADGVITALTQAAIDEIFVNGIMFFFAAKAMDQSASHTSGAASSRPYGRRRPRAPDNRTPRRTGGRADRRAGTATYGGGFHRLLGAST